MQPRGRLFSLACFLCLFCLLALGTAPPALDTVRFAVIGDSGSGKDGQYQVAQQMLAWHDRLPYQLVLMLGDNIYGWFWRGGRKQEFGRKFDRPYAELLRRGVVFRAALGNHDMYTRQGQDLIEAWDRFHIDGPLGYYSFTAGQLPGGAPLIEFFVLTSSRLDSGKQDPEQLAWLERALSASRARWRIAYFHHPIYSTGASHGSHAKLRARLEPLFAGSVPAAQASDGFEKLAGGNEPRVHVVLSGHDHIYERFHLQQKILYFVVGSSGKLRRGDARSSPQVAAVNDQTRSFLLAEATAEQLQFWAIDETGRAFDCTTLDRTGSVTPEPCPALR